jgi:hypothetical protein
MIPPQSIQLKEIRHVLHPVDLSYRLLSDYNLILAQKLTSYPLVLVGLSCGSSSFARVSNELPTSRTVVALRHGHLSLLAGRLAELSASLSSDPAFVKQARRLCRQSGGATSLKKGGKSG